MSKRGISRRAIVYAFLLTLAGCDCMAKPGYIKPCEKNEVLCGEKGYTKNMNKKLKPRIIKPEFIIWALTGIEKKNTAASMNDEGEFSFLKISGEWELSRETIMPGYPDDDVKGPGLDLQARKNIIWQVAPGGVQVMDIDRKKYSDFGQREINENQVFVADYEKKLMLVKVHEDEDPYALDSIVNLYYFLYDIENNKKIFSLPKMKNINYNYRYWYFSFSNQLLLDKIFHNKKGQEIKHKWFLSDIYSKKKKNNRITKVLSKLQISNIIKVNVEKRRIFTRCDTNGFYYIISWDKDMEEVKYKQLIFPSAIIIRNLEPVDPGFRWFVGFKEHSNPLNTEPEDLVAYYIDDSDPPNLIGPIEMGHFGRMSRGAFMKHETFGDLYLVIENYKDADNVLYVFQLDEGLKMVRGKR